MLSVIFVFWLQTMQDGYVSFCEGDAELLIELCIILVSSNVEA